MTAFTSTPQNVPSTPSLQYYKCIATKSDASSSSSSVPSKCSAIDKPETSDILCGRNKDSFNHLGNQRFRAVLREKVPMYANARSRTEKSALILQLTRMFLYQQGARFLKLQRNGSGWVELDETGARKKVGHALRDMHAAQQCLVNKHPHGRGREMIQELNKEQQQPPNLVFSTSLIIPDSETLGLKTNLNSLFGNSEQAAPIVSETSCTIPPEHNPMLDPLPPTASNARSSRFRMSAMQIMQEILSDNAVIAEPRLSLCLEDAQLEEDLISAKAWDALLSTF